MSSQTICGILQSVVDVQMIGYDKNPLTQQTRDKMLKNSNSDATTQLAATGGATIRHYRSEEAVR